MAGLTGRTPAASFGEVLTIGSSAGQAIGTTPRPIVDGGGNVSTLKLATNLTESAGIFKVSGTLGSGTSMPDSGARQGAYFYPKKLAFLGGQAMVTEWDDANIGSYSFNYGDSNVASGQYSFAIGITNVTSGAVAAAIGDANDVSGDRCFAAGLANIISAAATASVALGQNHSISHSNVVALGRLGASRGTDQTIFAGGSANGQGFRMVGVGTLTNSGNVSLRFTAVSGKAYAIRLLAIGKSGSQIVRVEQSASGIWNGSSWAVNVEAAVVDGGYPNPLATSFTAAFNNGTGEISVYAAHTGYTVNWSVMADIVEVS